MVERYLEQGPLAHLHLAARAVPTPPDDAGVTLAEPARHGMVGLRGRAGDAGFRDAAQRILGLALPTEPNSTAASAGVTAFWLGPDEWLIAAAPERAAGLTTGLREALAGRHHAVLDLGSARATIAVAGRHARDVLAKGCALDLHPRAFTPGDFAQSHYGKAAVLLYQADDTPRYELTTTRSFAEYLWLRLEDAAQEYGCAVVAG